MVTLIRMHSCGVWKDVFNLCQGYLTNLKAEYLSGQRWNLTVMETKDCPYKTLKVTKSAGISVFQINFENIAVRILTCPGSWDSWGSWSRRSYSSWKFWSLRFLTPISRTKRASQKKLFFSLAFRALGDDSKGKKENGGRWTSVKV